MTLTDQQKRQQYVTALHRCNPSVYTRRALEQAPTANLRALCAQHGLAPEPRRTPGETPLTLVQVLERPAIRDALTWYASQRPAALDLDAWMPPSFLGAPARPFVPPTVRALTAEEEAWLPVPFFKPKA